MSRDDLEHYSLIRDLSKELSLLFNFGNLNRIRSTIFLDRGRCMIASECQIKQP